MSEGPSIDQGALNFSRGVGQSAKAGPDDGTNDKDTIEALVSDAPEKIANTATKLTGGLLPSGIGKTSAMAGLETDGFANKNIVDGGVLRDTQGGFLAKLFHDIFIKTLARKEDHTQGVGEGGSGGFASSDGSFSSGDGGFSSGDSGTFASGGSSSFHDLVGDMASMGSYPWVDASYASLGTFSPPNVGVGQSHGAGMEV